MRWARALAVLVASAAPGAMAGCYQMLGGGYVHRLAEVGGPSFEAQWLIGIGDVMREDEPTAFGKVSVAGGGWGMRAADSFGVMLLERFGAAGAFVRPGLDILVIGVEDGSDAIWVGIGADLDAGFLVPLDDDVGIEIGARVGGDLSYTGEGSGGFVGAYIGVGWVFDGPDWYTH